MTSAEKDQIIEALSKQLNESSNFYVTNIANLTVAVTNELRRTCFKNDIKLKVVKNTLLKKKQWKEPEKTLQNYFLY